jgi:hypothetical protein
VVTSLLAVGALVHGVDRDENRRIADRRRGDAADRALGMAVVVDVGIVEHDLAPAAQGAAPVGLALDEHVDQLVAQILGPRPFGQFQPGVPDAVVDAVEVDGVLHHPVADAIATAGTGPVAEQHDLGLGQLDPRRARGDRRVEVEVAADLIGPRHLDLAQRDGDAERGGAVGHAHGFVDLAGRRLAPALGVAHAVDGQQRRLGLDVVDVRRVVDAGIGHRRLDRIGHLLDHGRPADVLGQQLDAHGRPHHQARLVFRAGRVVPREHRGVRRHDAVAAARPHHGDLGDGVGRSRSALTQHSAECLIGQDAGEVVDPAVALGLADGGDHLVGLELPRIEARLQAGCVLHVLELEFRDFDGHCRPSPLSNPDRGATWHNRRENYQRLARRPTDGIALGDGGGEAEHPRLVEPSPDDLEPHRHTVGAEARRHRGGRHAA